MLSKNFSEQEFVRTNHKIANALPCEFIRNRNALCSQLQVLRDFIGKPIVITSAYRSPELNEAVGGANGSRHLLCLAADIVCPGLSVLDLLCSVLNSSACFHKIIIEPSWLHVEVLLATSIDDDFPYMRCEFGFDSSFEIFYLSNLRRLVNLSYK